MQGAVRKRWWYPLCITGFVSASDLIPPLTGNSPGLEAFARRVHQPGDGLSARNERRRYIRRTTEDLSSPLDLLFPDSATASIINVSQNGLLIDTAFRLCPGNALAIILRSEHSRERVRARVVRSTVYRLQPSSVFRVALSLAHPIEWLDRLRRPE